MVVEATATVASGPTWRRDKRGRFVLPKHTLGWQILGWTADYLQHPDGPKVGEPWRFSDEQARLLLWWFAVDKRGGFVYRSGLLRRMKGWGKDPFGTAICCVELVGPSRFSHWGEDGQPVGQAHPAAWILVAAVARDQTRPTLTLFHPMLSARAKGEEVIARNAAKAGGRVLALTNAHAPGEDSDAQHDYETAEKIAQGLSPITDFLYDSLEAPEGIELDDDEGLRMGLLAARGASGWVTVPRIVPEIRAPRTSPATARRFYLNQIVAEEDKPFNIVKWNELARPGYVVPAGSLITLGFDGSISRDHTALIGTEVATAHQWVVGYWEPLELPDGEMRIPFMEIDETVDAAFKRWKVWRFNGDPYKWKEMLGAWAGGYGADVVVSWSTTLYRKMATSLLAYRNAIETGALTHDGDPRFAACIENSHKQIGR